MAILQSRPLEYTHGVQLTLIDDHTMRWVTKGKRARRALQAIGYNLTVITQDIDFRPYSVTPAGYATFSRKTFHRLPRSAFWVDGTWNYRQPPYDPGYGFATFIDPRTKQLVLTDDDERFMRRLPTYDEDRMALDALVEAFTYDLPEGVYDYDAWLARRNPTRRRGRRQ